ncbi:hypothetical protein RUND412_002429 [Rhizina undulata]
MSIQIPPNLQVIGTSMQAISHTFADICIELDRLSNLPSVDILTQLQQLNEQLQAKEHIAILTKHLDQMDERHKEVTKRIDDVVALVQGFDTRVGSLDKRLVEIERRLGDVEICQSTFVTKTTLANHVAAVEHNNAARAMNRLLPYTNYYGTRAINPLRDSYNNKIPKFPVSTQELNDLTNQEILNLLVSLKVPPGGDDTRNRLKEFVGLR